METPLIKLIKDYEITYKHYYKKQYMLNIKPINGYLVRQKYAKTVVCPEHNSFTPSEKRLFAEKNPNNYINTIRYIDDFNPSKRLSYKDILKINKLKIKEIIDKGFYKKIKNSLLIYQLETKDGHIQTGLMTDLSFNDYEKGNIRIHEYTRKDKEKSLSRYIKKVGAVSTPICITYARHSSIDDIIYNIINNNSADLILETDIIQRIWVIKDHSNYDEIKYYFKQIDICYLADGHHRIASGNNFAKKCKEKNPNHNGKESYNYLMAVLFPDDEMIIHAYNRCVKNITLSSKTLLKLIQIDFVVEKHENKYHAQPMHRHEFGMLLDGIWYKAIAKSHIIPSDPVNSLAVSILQNKILGPILSISDPQKDSRLDYISGDLGIDGMENAIKNGFDIAFSIFPTSIQEIMNVSDNKQVMPPKSTWFTPKLRSGLVVTFRNK